MNKIIGLEELGENVGLANVTYYEGVSKKTGKSYNCLWLSFLGKNGVVRVPLFLAPWDWKTLGVDTKQE